MRVGILGVAKRSHVAKSLFTGYQGLAGAALHDTGRCFFTAALRLIDIVMKRLYGSAQL